MGLQNSFPGPWAEARDAALESEATDLSTEEQNAPRDLGIFLLEPVLPLQTMYLNVFEPRYRALIAHCLEAGCGFGMTHDPQCKYITEVSIERVLEQHGRLEVKVHWLSD